MIRRAALRLENHRLAFQIFHHDFDSAVVKEIAVSDATADPRYFNVRPDEMAAGLECAVALILKEQYRLAIFSADIRGVHLRIDVAIDHEEIRPAVVLTINEAVAPPDVRRRARRDARAVRLVTEVHVAIVAIEHRVLVAEMGDSDAEPAGVNIVA